MEEKIKVFLLGKEIDLFYHQIQNLKVVVTPQILKEIRFPQCLSKFKPELNVLHSCFYYLITVDKNLQQSQSVKFRQKCISNISDYYIMNKMNFQLYEYGYLCGKLLSIPIDKAMHTIYFLVYTRLASKPFINVLIAQMERKGQQWKKKTIMKSQKQLSIPSKSCQSRHMTIFFDSNQMQSQLLKKQLHKIMSPQQKQAKKMTKKIENKRYFNLRKVYPDDADLKEQALSQYNKYKSTNSSRLVNIPIKVDSNENSSVITRLKLKTGIGESSLKKIKVRRQKFNEWFDTNQRYEQIMSGCDSKENKNSERASKYMSEKEAKNIFSNAYKHQKHPYEYYKDLSKNIKTKNQQLDNIRQQCFHHNDKDYFNSLKECPHQNYFQRGIMFNMNVLRTEDQKVESISQQLKNAHTFREMNNYNYNNQDNFNDFEKERDGLKNSKTTSVCKLSETDPSASIVTRKNEAQYHNDHTNSLFCRKVKNKFKLQKYKQQYRLFQKTQVFQRVKNNPT